jgi:phage baseplate assembly protein W
MASQRISRAFKDISFSFDPHPITKDLPVIINERAITRSVRNLVETILTERPFNPDLGSNIRKMLFENVTIPTSIEIKDQIENSILAFEPRVSNLIVDVRPFPDDNTFEVDIKYDIRGLDVDTQIFSFLLEATR